MDSQLVRSDSSLGTAKVVTGFRSKGQFWEGLCPQPIKCGLTPGSWSEVTVPFRFAPPTGFMIIANEDLPVYPSANGRKKVITDNSSSSTALLTNDESVHPSNSCLVYKALHGLDFSSGFLMMGYIYLRVLVGPRISFKELNLQFKIM